MADVLDRPFFIIGAPRSGTTYLADVLHRHPRLICTDETRVMTWVNRALNDLPTDQRTIMTYRDRWLAHLRTELPGIVRRFYEGLGAGGDVRWGDKNPHYADPRTDPAALPTIDALFPESQFIHLVRDGRNVVVSLLAKGWAKHLRYGIDVWRRHVTTSSTFGRSLGPDRFLELRYEDLVADEAGSVEMILSFLGVPEDEDLNTYLREGQSAQRPVSQPLTPADRFGAPMWNERLTKDEVTRVEFELADLLVAYGYESEAWGNEIRARGAPPSEEDEREEKLGARVKALLNATDPPTDELVETLREVNRRRREAERALEERERELAQVNEALLRARAAERGRTRWPRIRKGRGPSG